MTLLGPFAGLAFRFTVDCDSPVLASQVDRVFASLVTETDGPVARFVVRSPRGGHDGTVRFNDQVVLVSNSEYRLYAHLLWQLNQGAIRETRDKVLLHASAAEVDGRAVVMCAPSNSGKTTLVASLVMAGMRYLTDEVVGLDVENGGIAPFPKALAVDRGSWEVLSELQPVLPKDATHLIGDQWQVPPAAIRPGAVSMGAQPALFLIPHYDPTSITGSRSLTPGEALVALAQETFALPRHPARDLTLLARALEAHECRRLTVSDIGSAVTEIRALLGLAAAKQGPERA